MDVDLNELLAHHLLVVGATGSGKSTSMLSLVEQLQKAGQTTIIFDATGEYRHLDHAVVYQLGVNANLQMADLNNDAVASILAIKSETLKHKLEAAIQSLKIQQNVVASTGTYLKLNKSIAVFNEQIQTLVMSGKDYNPAMLSDQIIEEFIIPSTNDVPDFNLLGQQYNYPSIQHFWDNIIHAKLLLTNDRLQRIYGIRNSVSYNYPSQPMVTQTDLNYVLKLFSRLASKNRSLVIDVSALAVGTESSQTVISILLKQLLDIRSKNSDRLPLTIFLDEAHRYIPNHPSDLMDSGIFKILREGRKYGIYTVLSTQSPLDLPVQLRGHFGSYLVHKLQDQAEISAILGKYNKEKIAHLAVGSGMLKLFGKKKAKQVTVIKPQALHDTASPRF
ncbi:ATP-binding protein [Leuconostoc rapi]|uniref:ATP-binding protein n=1 Tax=Leuconostoc rapi TaxID=1406906 RepID=UPI00218027F6|nr:ATP-binding protein [Leuconostoc rapi]